MNRTLSYGQPRITIELPENAAGLQDVRMSGQPI